MAQLKDLIVNGATRLVGKLFTTDIQTTTINGQNVGGTPKFTDTNTTYSLTQDSSDRHKITLTPSSGTAQTITIPDNDTKATVTTSGTGNVVTALTASNGALTATKGTFYTLAETDAAIAVETLARQTADNSLQNQINAITSRFPAGIVPIPKDGWAEVTAGDREGEFYLDISAPGALETSDITLFIYGVYEKDRFSAEVPESGTLRVYTETPPEADTFGTLTIANENSAGTVSVLFEYAESWVFTLDDSSTVTKRVVLI